jgi:hypothetical protein
VFPPQLPLSVQVGTQVCWGEQIPLAQLLLLKHSTQVSLVVLQYLRLLGQLASPTHSTHFAVVVLQNARGVAQLASVAQPLLQLKVVWSQSGAEFGQLVFDKQPTHSSVFGSHSGAL